jgi:hypothetical protein
LAQAHFVESNGMHADHRAERGQKSKHAKTKADCAAQNKAHDYKEHGLTLPKLNLIVH